MRTEASPVRLRTEPRPERESAEGRLRARKRRGLVRSAKAPRTRPERESAEDSSRSAKAPRTAPKYESAWSNARGTKVPKAAGGTKVLKASRLRKRRCARPRKASGLARFAKASPDTADWRESASIGQVRARKRTGRRSTRKRPNGPLKGAKAYRAEAAQSRERASGKIHPA
jgi:hypothetical protein